MTATTAPPRRFKITANMVTMARIVALPLPAGMLLWGEETALWVAFVVGAVLGATDFVDGYMARKDGTTVLGALLDPVADKLFIAALLLPIVSIGHCPAWAAGLLFVRELLITAMRSTMAVRKAQLKTSQLGKLKTVVQMGGLATYFITLAVRPPAMQIIHGICALIMVIIAVAVGARRKAWPPAWLTGGALLWVLVAGLTIWFEDEPGDAAFWQFMIMVVFSWVSGFDYLVGAQAMFRREGLTRMDASRIFSSIAIGFFAVIVVDDHPEVVIPIALALCAELSLGGIDNVVTAERGRTSRGVFIPQGFLALIMCALSFYTDPAQPAVLVASLALAAFTIGNAVYAFVGDKDVFFTPPSQGS